MISFSPGTWWISRRVWTLRLFWARDLTNWGLNRKMAPSCGSELKKKKITVTVLSAGSNPVSMCYPGTKRGFARDEGALLLRQKKKKAPLERWGDAGSAPKQSCGQRPSKVRQGGLRRVWRQGFSCTEPLCIPKSTSGQLGEPTSFFWTWLFVKTIGYGACMDFKGRTVNVIWPRQLWPFIASIFLRYCCQGLKCLHAPWF